MQTNLTIIIVSFNSAGIISQCLSEINFAKYKVVVVDNCSSDNTTQIIEQNFPQVQLIKLPRNIGYGKGNNVALRETETEFALILNPDAYIFEDDVEICLNLLRQNQEIALAMPRIFKDQIEAKNTTREDFNDITEVEFAYGGTLFMRMEVFRQIGFFDENYFMFAEDNELSDRSIKNGYKNVIINTAKAFHQGGSSSKKSLRITYRRFWHLGWSKSRYKQFKKGKLQTIRATARLSLIYFCEGIFYLIIGNINKSVGKFAFSSGCFSCLIGLKAFDKNGNPRG